MFFAVSSTPSLSSIEMATPICASSPSMVVTSRRCGTLVTVSGSDVSSAAVRMGSVAFFAPEISTSPASGAPPSMTSLSTLRPVLGGVGLHGKRVDLARHAAAERRVHQLVLLNARLPAECGAHDHRLEMMAVAPHLHVLAGEPFPYPALDLSRIDHERSLYPVRSSHRVNIDKPRKLA